MRFSATPSRRATSTPVADLTGNYLDHCHVVTVNQHALMAPVRAQTTHATAMGTSSFAAKFRGFHSSSHGCCSHACCHTAPQPHDFEESDEMDTVGNPSTCPADGDCPDALECFERRGPRPIWLAWRQVANLRCGLWPSRLLDIALSISVDQSRR